MCYFLAMSPMNDLRDPLMGNPILACQIAHVLSSRVARPNRSIAGRNDPLFRHLQGWGCKSDVLQDNIPRFLREA